MLVTGSATHDERVYEEPELFDIHRVVQHPVTFGFGIHVCLGAHLARLEVADRVRGAARPLPRLRHRRLPRRAPRADERARSQQPAARRRRAAGAGGGRWPSDDLVRGRPPGEVGVGAPAAGRAARGAGAVRRRSSTRSRPSCSRCRGPPGGAARTAALVRARVPTAPTRHASCRRAVPRRARSAARRGEPRRAPVALRAGDPAGRRPDGAPAVARLGWSLHEGPPGLRPRRLDGGDVRRGARGAAARRGRRRVTAELTVRYRRPTPVGAELVLRRAGSTTTGNAASSPARRAKPRGARGRGRSPLRPRCALKPSRRFVCAAIERTRWGQRRHGDAAEAGALALQRLADEHLEVVGVEDTRLAVARRRLPTYRSVSASPSAATTSRRAPSASSIALNRSTTNATAALAGCGSFAHGPENTVTAWGRWRAELTIPGVLERQLRHASADRRVVAVPGGAVSPTRTCSSRSASGRGRCSTSRSSAGERVAVWAPNSIEWVVASLAPSPRSARSSCRCNTRWQLGEVLPLVERAGCGVWLAEDAFLGKSVVAVGERGVARAGDHAPVVRRRSPNAPTWRPTARSTRGSPRCRPTTSATSSSPRARPGGPRAAAPRHGAMVATTACVGRDRRPPAAPTATRSSARCRTSAATRRARSRA